MKLKYYLRGVGTGILFATIVLLISYTYKMSDSQIKKRALELGMVYQTEEESSSNVADNSSNNEETSDNTSTDEPSSEEPSSDEPSSDEPSSEEPSSEEPSSEEPSTEEPTTKPSGGDGTVKTCTVTVNNRTGSDDVARQLANAGLIDSADDFNDYLINNGYAYRIQNGTFTFTSDMTYEQMAQYLVTGRK